MAASSSLGEEHGSLQRLGGWLADLSRRLTRQPEAMPPPPPPPPAPPVAEPPAVSAPPAVAAPPAVPDPAPDPIPAAPPVPEASASAEPVPVSEPPAEAPARPPTPRRVRRLRRPFHRVEAPAPPPPPPVTRLALQGGGAHGAYTWGVLDRLLEDDGPTIDAVTGTSAGAMNAVVLAHGLASAPGAAGRQAARQALAGFWNRVGAATAFSPYHPPGGSAMGESLWRAALDVAGRLFTPTQLNPLGLRPLRTLLEETVDFAAIRSGPVAVTVAATRVRDGAAHLFSGPELSVDAVLASACLPLLFPAVEIDGEAYWDGGYVANPPLAPLLGGTAPVDLVLVPINPSSYDGVPHAPHDILDRLGDLTFNAGLVAELAVVEREQAWRAAGLLSPAARPEVRVHAIRADAALAALGSASKLRPEPALLRHLFAVGRAAAAEWLAAQTQAQAAAVG